ncbi:MAG TPA: Holliday junction resolvase RuvX [Methylococcaceae bacterium]|jgi:putative Holliday junction resolvase|nr:Holliday junction resolvase RuvX [Methylococcaceae bacterium]
MPDPLQRSGTFLGIDYGRKGIGVAVGQRMMGTARALETIRATNRDHVWNCLSQLVKTWLPEGFVVGTPVPLDENQPKNPMIEEIALFCNDLEARFGLPVHLMDEALSTRESQSLFYAERPKKSVDFRKVKDQMAAALILETWLSHTANQGV